MTTLIEDDFSFASLIVERGIPYEKGARFLLQQSKLFLGRTTNSFNPDISFDSMLISRKHCCIEQQNGIWNVCELGSKHGTMLNGKFLAQGVPYSLKHGDEIGLASGIVLLHFALSREFERTLDFGNTQSLETKTISASKSPVLIDITQRSLLIDHLEVLLSIKEWRLLELLYNNKNDLVSYETIRMIVWNERYSIDDGMPDVGSDEMNILIYRLRRKFGDYSYILKTRRGQGCILQIE